MKRVLSENKNWIDGVWRKIEKKVSVTSDRIRDGMPYTTKNGKYDDYQSCNPSWWTNSFWCGILWYMYRETKDNKYREYAQSIENKLDKVLYDYDELHHDTGFMWLLTSVMSFELTGDENSRKRAMLAASVLSARGNINGKYIRAWNDNHIGWAIIDCMMNIPLLYWASKTSGDARFSNIAVMHADKTMKTFIREDGSACHIAVFDAENGDLLETKRGQGYAVGSSWSRGQGWAVYGFIQSFNWTQKQEYLDVAKRAAHYVISNLAQNDYLPLCDYRQPLDSELLDSSAGAVTACGLIETAKAVSDSEKALYLKSAISILKTLDEKCGIWDDSDEALLKDGTSQYHLDNGPYEVKNGALIYGDFYFVEAICKLKELSNAL